MHQLLQVLPRQLYLRTFRSSRRFWLQWTFSRLQICFAKFRASSLPLRSPGRSWIALSFSKPGLRVMSSTSSWLFRARWLQQMWWRISRWTWSWVTNKLFLFLTPKVFGIAYYIVWPKSMIYICICIFIYGHSVNFVAPVPPKFITEGCLFNKKTYITFYDWASQTDTLSDKCSGHSICHSVWHFIWQSFWHVVWHCVWSFTCHSSWHLELVQTDIESDIPSGSLSGVASGNLLDILSDRTPGLLSGIPTDILSDMYSDILPDEYSDILCDAEIFICIYSDPSGILPDMHCEILPRNRSGSLWDRCCDTLSGFLAYTLWHIFWQSMWHWYLDILSGFVSDFLDDYMTYFLTFYLALYLTFYLSIYIYIEIYIYILLIYILLKYIYIINIYILLIYIYIYINI